MKRQLHTYVLAFLTAGSLVFASCEKPEDDNSNNTPKASSISATIDGTAFNSNGIPAIQYDATNDMLDATYYDKNQVTVVALNFSLEKTGNLDLIAGDAFVNIQLSSQNDGLYAGSSGTVTLTSIDKAKKVVEGTFNVTAKNANDVAITASGSFVANYNK